MSNNNLENITPGLKKQLEVSTNNFEMWLNTLDAQASEFENKVSNLKMTANVLKISMVLSGILLATGFIGEYESLIKIIGGAVVIIPAIERIIANFDKLMIFDSANSAILRVRREVVKLHTLGLGSILAVIDSDPNHAAKKLIELQDNLTKKIIDIDNEIKNTIASKNRELLGRLSLEDNKKDYQSPNLLTK